MNGNEDFLYGTRKNHVGVCEHFVKNYEKFGKPLTLIF